MVYFKTNPIYRRSWPLFIFLSTWKIPLKRPLEVKGWKVQPDLWLVNRLDAFPIKLKKKKKKKKKTKQKKKPKYYVLTDGYDI